MKQKPWRLRSALQVIGGGILIVMLVRWRYDFFIPPKTLRPELVHRVIHQNPQVFWELQDPEVKKGKKTSGLAIACAFSYKKDFQRGVKQTHPREYIKLWYESIQRHPEMHGVIIGDMFDEALAKKYTTSQIEFLRIDPSTHPSFTQVPDSDKRSINDQVYFVQEWYLNQTSNKYEHVVLTDLHDIEFLRNPFDYMKTMDQATGGAQLYVQAEHPPIIEGMKWLNDVWTRCFHEALPDEYRHSVLYNSGILGGRIDRVRSFVHDMNEMFLSFPHKDQNCNMVVFGSLLHYKYHDNVVYGYPWHTKFKRGNEDTQWLSQIFIKHK